MREIIVVPYDEGWPEQFAAEAERISAVFGDYLAAHPRRAEQYAALKMALAQEYRLDPPGYVAAKAAFIQETLSRAEQINNGGGS